MDVYPVYKREPITEAERAEACEKCQIAKNFAERRFLNQPACGWNYGGSLYCTAASPRPVSHIKLAGHHVAALQATTSRG